MHPSRETVPKRSRRARYLTALARWLVRPRAESCSRCDSGDTKLGGNGPLSLLAAPPLAISSSTLRMTGVAGDETIPPPDRSRCSTRGTCAVSAHDLQRDSEPGANLGGSQRVLPGDDGTVAPVAEG